MLRLQLDQLFLALLQLTGGKGQLGGYLLDGVVEVL
jgi:hypothetical protein